MATIYSPKSNFKKGLSWIISAFFALVISESINKLFHTYTSFESMEGLFLGIFQSTGNVWDNLFNLSNFIILLALFFLIISEIEHKVRLILFRRQLPNVIKEFNLLKRKINHTIVTLIDAGNDKHINDRDEIYADLLRQMQSEFDVEGVSIDSINKCTDELKNILHNTTVSELYALTNLYSDSWLTRTMLLYLIRTIQIADKITSSDNKLRVFIRNKNGSNNDNKSYESIKSLHEGFLPTKEITHENLNNPIDAFLYLKTSNKEELFWYVDEIETKLYWAGKNQTMSPEKANEIKTAIAHLKSI